MLKRILRGVRRRLRHATRRGDPRGFPWYDSPWLADYTRCRDYLAHRHPDRLADFDEAMGVFQTPPAFEVTALPSVLDAQTLAEANALAKSLDPQRLESHERASFGRHVVHNHEYFNALQAALCPLVSEHAGMQLEPHYNFLSLYREDGRCDLHLDAPEAMWTLDVCLSQSYPWPILISNVVPWPTRPDAFPEGWEDEVLKSPDVHMSSHTLTPGSGILFSGSSQWHVREPLPPGEGHHGNLIFFHYIPRGSGALLRPRDWARHFKVRGLAARVHH